VNVTFFALIGAVPSMMRCWSFPLRVMPLAGPTMYRGPSELSGASSVIVAPSRLGSKWIAPPPDLIWLTSDRSDPISRPPLAFVTVSSTKSSLADAERLGFDGILGATGSSAQAPIRGSSSLTSVPL